MPSAATVDITGITADSRQVSPGFLFAAMPGTRRDGLAFVAEALARGAAAVLSRPDPRLDGLGVPVVVDDNPRRRLALLAARFYPRQPETIVAVTGTSGKTSVADFCRQLWAGLGEAAASVGTLGVVGPRGQEKLLHTTPDPVALHDALQGLADQGVRRLAMEASSHGLDQYRLDGVRLRAAAFTSFSRDHLDYHASAEDYLEAKMRLFGALLPAGGTAVLNADCAESTAAARLCEQRGIATISYGRAGADVRLLAREPEAEGQRLVVDFLGERHELRLPLVGDFQAMNALCAAALVVACGSAPKACLELLPQLRGVPGRLQRVAEHPSGAAIFVDYAHKPDALANALAALRGHASRRLVVVFGCGGDRDRGKRPQMGRIAAELADLAIVTDDNPRTEEPAAIRREVMAGCPGGLEIADRADAIRTAVGGLAAGDVLLIAGKGHEQGQIVGDVVRPFDDAEQARAAVSELTEAGHG